LFQFSDQQVYLLLSLLLLHQLHFKANFQSLIIIERTTKLLFSNNHKEIELLSMATLTKAQENQRSLNKKYLKIMI
jgi:hypothetical protein